MNSCPVCESQYTDETLRFCLQDGTPLTSNIKQSAVETIAFSNPLTVEKILQTEEMRINFSDQTQRRNEPTVINPLIQQQTAKSTSSRMFLLAGLPLLIVLGASGIGGWFYLNNQNRNVLQNPDDKALVKNNPEKTLPVNTSVVSTETISEKPPQPQSTNLNSDEVKKEIADFINVWKGSFESRNIVEYTAKYAETVDYYDKTGANVKEIRGDVQKIFTDYKEIEITLSNVRVAVDSDSEKATAVFDKEWSYETEKDLSEGKTHTKLQFEKSGNEWKIVSEKTLKTYYVEN